MKTIQQARDSMNAVKAIHSLERAKGMDIDHLLLEACESGDVREWKRLVQLKATATGPLGSEETMSNRNHQPGGR